VRRGAGRPTPGRPAPVCWTGPWSGLTGYIPYEPKITAIGSLGGTAESSWKFAPFVAGTAILASWILIAAFLRPNSRRMSTAFRNTFRQMWARCWWDR